MAVAQRDETSGSQFLSGDSLSFTSFSPSQAGKGWDTFDHEVYCHRDGKATRQKDFGAELSCLLTLDQLPTLNCYVREKEICHVWATVLWHFCYSSLTYTQCRNLCWKWDAAKHLNMGPWLSRWAMWKNYRQPGGKRLHLLLCDQLFEKRHPVITWKADHIICH